MAQSPKRTWRRSKGRAEDGAGDVQMQEKTWYVVGHHDLHECCDCGLVHKVKYKFEKGRIWESWERDEHETRKSRKLGP